MTGILVPMTPPHASDGAPRRWRSPRPRSSSGSRCRRSDRGSAGMASPRRHGRTASTGATRSMRSARCAPCATRSRADTPPARPSRSSAPARPRVTGAASTWIASRRAPRCSIRTASEGRSTWRRRSSGWNAPSSRWRFPACGDGRPVALGTMRRRQRASGDAGGPSMVRPARSAHPTAVPAAPAGARLRADGAPHDRVGGDRGDARAARMGVQRARRHDAPGLAPRNAHRDPRCRGHRHRPAEHRADAARSRRCGPPVRCPACACSTEGTRSRRSGPGTACRGIYLGTDLRAAVDIVGRRSAERRRHLRHRDRRRGWRASWPRRGSSGVRVSGSSRRSSRWPASSPWRTPSSR